MYKYISMKNAFEAMKPANSEVTPPTFIFIDGSYYCFYRYYSLLTWWKNAYPQEDLKDPFANEKFVEKFRKTFVEHIEKIPQKLNIHKQPHSIIVGKDCKRENIWRHQLFDKYKANRDYKEDEFMGGPFFEMAYRDNLFAVAGARAILSHPKLEADDCIALSVRHILSKYQDCKIYIITSDKDYLQLLEPRVKIFNLAFKNLEEQKSYPGDPKLQLFCKIVTGDPSDNIPQVLSKCGDKTAIKLYNDRAKFEERLKKEDAWDKFERNQRLVNFDFIPEDLKAEFMTNFCSQAL